MSVLPQSDVINSNHENCEVVIIYRLWKNKTYPTPGLYCAEHGKLIKWLSFSDADFLEFECNVRTLGLPDDEYEKFRQLRKGKHKSPLQVKMECLR